MTKTGSYCNNTRNQPETHRLHRSQIKMVKKCSSGFLFFNSEIQGLFEHQNIYFYVPISIVCHSSW